MDSLIYDAALYALARGEISFAADAFKVMLVGAAYVPSKAAHAKRSDVSGEISGKGYEAGGSSVVVAASRVEGGIEISLGGKVWGPASIGATGAVYYRDAGSPADDALVAFVSFGDPVVATNGDFTLDRSFIDLVEQ